MADKEPDAGAASTRREVIKLLRELDPDSRPTFHGRPIDRAGIEELARAAATGDRDSQTTLNELYELRVIGDVSGDPELADVDQRWHVNVELLPTLTDGMGRLADPLRTDDAARALPGQILLAIIDADVRRDFGVRATAEHAVLEADGDLRETLSRVYGEGDEPVRVIAAALAYERAQERYDRELEEREAAEEAAKEERQAADDAEANRREEQAQIADEEKMRPVRRRDRVIVVAALVLVGTVWPAAALGDLLSRGGPLRDGGPVLLRRLGIAMPVFTAGYWATGSVAILTVACLALCVRRQIRRHRIAMAALAAFALAVGVLALMLPGIRDSVWANEMSRIAASPRGPCTNSEGAAYTLRNGFRQPINVGPQPSCQLITRFSHQRAHAIWQTWIPKIHVRRVHKFDTALVVGGTYGGRRTPQGLLKGGRLLVVSLGPLSGRERWRRTCRAPSDGEHAIAFSTAKIGGRDRPLVRLRCGDGRILRLNPRTGHTL